MKNNLKLLLLLVVTFFISCQTDDDQTLVNDRASGITFKSITFDEFKTNKKAFTELQSAVARNRQARIVNDPNGFFYDEEQVIVAEYDNIKTYTFRIYRTTPTGKPGFENLVIRESVDGASSYIMNYYFTETDIANLEQNLPVRNIESKGFMTSITGDPTGIHRREDGTCFVPHWYGPNGEYDGVTWYEKTVPCPDKEGTIDHSFTDPGNPTSGGGGGGYNYGTPPINIIIVQPTLPGLDPYNPGSPPPGHSSIFDGAPVVTTPVFNVMMNSFMSALYKTDRPMYDWVMAHPTIKAKLQEFLGYDRQGYHGRAELAMKIVDFAMEDEDGANEEIANQLFDYLDEEDNSEESMEISMEIIDSIESNINVCSFPFFRYPTGSNYSVLYPKTTAFLKNELPKAKDNPTIINTIVDITGLTPGRVKYDLTWGKGPTIHITQLDDACETCNDLTGGLFDPNQPDKIFIDIDLVNLIENEELSPEDSEQLQFCFTVLILHEYVHLGDNVDHIDYPGEEGSIFEARVWGVETANNNRQFYVRLIRN